MYERVGVMAVRKAKVKGESKKRAEKITWIAEAEGRAQGGTARFPSNQRGDKQGEERGEGYWEWVGLFSWYDEPSMVLSLAC